MSTPKTNSAAQRTAWRPGQYIGDGADPRTFTAGNIVSAVPYRDREAAHNAMDSATCAIRKMLRACGVNDNPREARKLA